MPFVTLLERLVGRNAAVRGSDLIRSISDFGEDKIIINGRSFKGGEDSKIRKD